MLDTPPAERGFTRIAARALLWVVSTLLLAFAAQPLETLADTGPLIVGSEDSYSLSRSFTYLEDPGGKLGWAEIERPEVQSRFKPFAKAGSATNFGVTRSAFWLRIDLQVTPGADEKWLLEVAYPSLDTVEVHSIDANGKPLVQKGGDLMPFAHRAVAHRNHVFALTLTPGRQSPLYLRIASEGTVAAPTRLWKPAALGQEDQREYSLLSLYFGLLIGLLLYNALLYLSIRDRSYLFYVLFVAGMGLTQASLSGIGNQFLWSNWLWWGALSAPICMAFSSAFALLFARDFLSTATTAPLLNRLILGAVGFCALTALATIFVSYRTGGQMVSVMAVFAPPVLVLAGVLSVKRKHPGAKYFLIAWAALLIGVVTLGLHNNGFLPTNSLTANALLIGSAIEMVLLSFALANRINTVRAESEQIRATSLAEGAKVEALQISQQRYRTVIDHVGEGMAVLDEGRVVFVNVCAAKILGASKEAIMENGFLAQIDPDDRELFQRRVRARLAAEALPDRYEMRIRRTDGELVWLEVGDVNVSWDGNVRVLVFFSDLTDRKKADEDARVALNQQQELNQLRSRFVAMSSHEFRTPLASILSSQELLQHYGDRLPEEEKTELHAAIATGVHRMTRMLDRVLVLGKAEAQMLEFDPQELDLIALCHTFVDEAKLQQANAACTVETDFAADLPKGRYDEKLLRHIFSNLLSNAIKYSPQGGVVTFRVFRDQSQIVMQVADQGIGIPPADLAHLFESFHRAGNVGAIHGTGLGLAIVKSSVSLHQGTIEVASEIGKGSCFTVRL